MTMSGTVKDAKLQSPTSRAKLPRKREPHWRTLIAGRAHLGWQRKPNAIVGKWILRRYIDGKYAQQMLGLADDCDTADNDRVLSFQQAEAKARARTLSKNLNSNSAALEHGIIDKWQKFLDQDIAPKSGTNLLEQRIAEKWREFLVQGIKPICFLYRHYDPYGDLLYVGISLDALKRQVEHSRESDWRMSIYQIIIEPFTTRERALEAEHHAIRTEFPKHNTAHNSHRHPFQELARWRDKED
jgi:hypothetical protein